MASYNLVICFIPCKGKYGVHIELADLDQWSAAMPIALRVVIGHRCYTGNLDHAVTHLVMVNKEYTILRS